MQKTLMNTGTTVDKELRAVRAAATGALLVICALLGGCYGEGNEESTLDLGSVSIGEQLIDLKNARDSGSLSGKEYREAKADLLLLLKNAAQFSADSEDESDERRDHKRDDSDDDDSDDDDDDDSDEEDEESGFLF